jgi:hypothetical protein
MSPELAPWKPTFYTPVVKLADRRAVGSPLVTFVKGNRPDVPFTRVRLWFSLLIEQHLGEG